MLQRVQRALYLRRVEFGVRGRRRRRIGLFRTRNRHGRFRTHSRRVQRHRGLEANARRAEHDGRRPGLPHARLCFDLRRKLCGCGAGLSGRKCLRSGRSLLASNRAKKILAAASGFRFGVPSEEWLKFFGDDEAAAAFQNAVDTMQRLGGIRTSIDYRPFHDAAELLYSGPWVAERLAAIKTFLKKHPDAMHPVTARIIQGASSITATDTFEAMYKLAELRRATEAEWLHMDFMLLPTAPRHYTHAEVAAEPVATNTNLGYYTNFVNLLDLAAVAAPAGMRGDGLPFGVSLIGPAWSEEALLETAGALHAGSADRSYCPAGYVPLAVCGAHLTGEPLNHQLVDAGAFLIEACRTSPEYRLYALRGTVPAKPGLAYSPGPRRLY